MENQQNPQTPQPLQQQLQQLPPQTPQLQLTPQPETYFAPPPVRPKKQLPKRENADGIFALLTFASAFLLVYLGLFGEMALGFSVAVFAAYAVLFIVAGVRKIEPRPLGVVYAACALVFAACYSLYSNPALAAAWFCAVVALTALFILELFGAMRFGHESYWCMRDVLRAVFVHPLIHIGDSVRFLFQKQADGRGTVGKVLIGLGISVPILAILIPILTSSDEDFARLIHNAFGDIGEIIGAFFLAAVLFFPLWSLLFGFGYEKQPPKAPDIAACRRVDPLILSVLLGAVGFLYLTYLLTKTAYFFAAFKSVVPTDDGFPADFARQGFFELCVIAVLNAVILMPVLALTRRKQTDTLPPVLRILSAVLCLETLLLIATALQKMVLYIQRFSLTSIRVYVSAFLVFLAVAWLILLLRLFVKKLPVMPLTALCAAAVLIVLTFGGTDVSIVRFNANHYTSGKVHQLDFAVFGDEYTISRGAVPELVRLAKSDNAEVQKQARAALARSYARYFDFTAKADEETGSWSPGEALPLYTYNSFASRFWCLDIANCIAALEGYKDEYFEWAKQYWVIYDSDRMGATFAYEIPGTEPIYVYSVY